MEIKSRVKLTLALVACLLAGCDFSADVREAKKAIEARLKDPESVRYRNVVSYAGGVVCGEWNSKNGSGGYGGFDRFIYKAKTASGYGPDLSMEVGFSDQSRECNGAEAQLAATR